MSPCVRGQATVDQVQGGRRLRTGCRQRHHRRAPSSHVFHRPGRPVSHAEAKRKEWPRCVGCPAGARPPPARFCGRRIWPCKSPNRASIRRVTTRSPRTTSAGRAASRPHVRRHVLEPLGCTEGAVGELPVVRVGDAHATHAVGQEGHCQIPPREEERRRQHERHVREAEESQPPNVGRGPCTSEDGAHQCAPHPRERRASCKRLASLSLVGRLGQRRGRVHLVVRDAERPLVLLSVRLIRYLAVARDLARPHLR
eukprot:scaffold14805_cov121-Isochrysis_galbana.AAC.10